MLIFVFMHARATVRQHMKLTAIMMVYDGADYISYAIESALELCDEVVVVEGALKPYVDMGHPHRSSDGTLSILQDIQTSPRVIVRHTEEPYSHHPAQYQLAFNVARDRGADWCILIDYDEIYPKDTQRIIKKVLVNPTLANKLGWRVHSYNFINDFYHYYDGCYKRIYKVTPEAHFVADSMENDNEVRWPDRQRIEDHMSWPPPSHIGVVPKNFRFFHYSYVKSHAHLERKKKFIQKKSGNPMNGYRIENGIYKIPDDIEVMRFDGAHPQIMKSHPLADVRYATWI